MELFHNCFRWLVCRGHKELKNLSKWWPLPVTLTRDPYPWPLPSTLALDPYLWPATLTLYPYPWPATRVLATPSTNKRSNICMLRSKIIRSHRKFVNGFTARRHGILERHLAQSDMRRLYSGSILVGVSEKAKLKKNSVWWFKICVLVLCFSLIKTSKV